MKEKKKRRRRCENCHELKHDVHRTHDPFMYDVHNKVVMKDLCGYCLDLIAAEI